MATTRAEATDMQTNTQTSTVPLGLDGLEPRPESCRWPTMTGCDLSRFGSRILASRFIAGWFVERWFGPGWFDPKLPETPDDGLQVQFHSLP